MEIVSFLYKNNRCSGVVKKLKTYVINLPKDVARRQNMEEVTGLLPYLDVEWVQAVYGKELSEEEIEQRFDRKKYQRVYHRLPFSGEIGCTLSHYECYKRILKSGEQTALILEDDVSFIEDSSLVNLLQKCVEFMEQDKPLILLLWGDFFYTGDKIPFFDRYTLYKDYNASSTIAYLVNTSAAKIMLKTNRPFHVADDWFFYRCQGIHVMSLYPSVMNHLYDCFGTSIKDLERSKTLIQIPLSTMEFKLYYTRIWALILGKLGIIKHL